jgi:hypothetical protein
MRHFGEFPMGLEQFLYDVCRCLVLAWSRLSASAAKYRTRPDVIPKWSVGFGPPVESGDVRIRETQLAPIVGRDGSPVVPVGGMIQMPNMAVKPNSIRS